MNNQILKVSNSSNVNSVDGAIVGVIKEKGQVEVQTIGAGAVNQTVKAIAIARGFIAPSGINLVCIPAFSEVEIEGQGRTGIKFIVKGEI